MLSITDECLVTKTDTEARKRSGGLCCRCTREEREARWRPHSPILPFSVGATPRGVLCNYSENVLYNCSVVIRRNVLPDCQRNSSLTAVPPTHFVIIRYKYYPNYVPNWEQGFQHQMIKTDWWVCPLLPNPPHPTAHPPLPKGHDLVRFVTSAMPSAFSRRLSLWLQSYFRAI